jgi:hypothetical protein
MLYGYNTQSRHLFFYDGDFHYKGVVRTEDIDVDITEGIVSFDDASVEYISNIESCWAGSYFLSGFQKNQCLSIYSDGEEISAAMVIDSDVVQYMPVESLSVKDHTIPICLSGPVCRKPDKVAELARLFPSNSFFACPLIEELPSLGALYIRARRDRRIAPRRITFDSAFDEEIPDFESMEFDKELDGDGVGIMARCVGEVGTPAINEMRSSLGISPFYGKTLASIPISEKTTYLMLPEDASRMFATEAISVKGYAASSVPVRVKCTEQFKEHSRCPRDEADIFLMTHYLPDTVTFMGFYMKMSGKIIATSCTPETVISDKTLPVFRYNKAYRVSLDWLKGRYLSDT